ncbi:MAG: histidine ammonia-lyase [Halobacteria archaeon]
MTVVADGDSLCIEDVVKMARKQEDLELSSNARDRIESSRERVEDVLESGETVYGLNTGFGELVDQRIEKQEIEDLQLNLVRSHSSGVGDLVYPEAVRAMQTVRVNSLAKGYSGVRPIVVELLVEMVNRDVVPVVPCQGSLGASGDLAPLAHATLVMIGEGEAWFDGERTDGGKALEAAGLEPVSLKAKEGLALINGTQLTAALSCLLVRNAERGLRAADAAGALTTEVTLRTTASCEPVLHETRDHDGQKATARHVRALTRGSDIAEAHRNCDRVQDAYSLRCIPQVHGAVRDAVEHLRKAVEVEINSATDNPLVFHRKALEEAERREEEKMGEEGKTGENSGDVGEDPSSIRGSDGDGGSSGSFPASGTGEAAVLSGGNFHGEPLALRLDYLTSAFTELAGISERRIDRLVNPNLQEEFLPPFLAGNAGVESGMMIAQYSAAALVNECRGVGSVVTDNIPVSGGQEDHVSMSSQAALDAQKIVDNAVRVSAIELLCACEAAEYVERAPELYPGAEPGVGTKAVYDRVRDEVPPLKGDRSLHQDIDTVDGLIRDGDIDTAVKKSLNR